MTEIYSTRLPSLEGVEQIIKHQHSKAHNASLFVQNLSRSVIAIPKKNKGSKNKFQQLKNIVHKLLSILYEQPLSLKLRRNPHANALESSRSLVPEKRHKTLVKGGGLEKDPGSAGPRLRYLGIGVAFGGRAYGAKKASTFKVLFGSVPFNTLSVNIDYPNIMEKTRNGT